MTPRVARITLRTAGTLVAAFGGLSLSLGLGMLVQLAVWPSAEQRSPERVVATLLFTAFFALIASWMLWIGYLVWFRMSRLAVRQTCGAVGFFVVSLCSQVFIAVGPLTTPPDRVKWIPVAGIAYVVLLAVVIWGYKRSSRKFEAVLFPPLPMPDGNVTAKAV